MKGIYTSEGFSRTDNRAAGPISTVVVKRNSCAAHWAGTQGPVSSIAGAVHMNFEREASQDRLLRKLPVHALVAQMDRAPLSYREGHWFESSSGHVEASGPTEVEMVRDALHVGRARLVQHVSTVEPDNHVHTPHRRYLRGNPSAG